MSLQGFLGYKKTWNLSAMGNNWKFSVNNAITDLNFKISPLLLCGEQMEAADKCRS